MGHNNERALTRFGFTRERRSQEESVRVCVVLERGAVGGLAVDARQDPRRVNAVSSYDGEHHFDPRLGTLLVDTGAKLRLAHVERLSDRAGARIRIVAEQQCAQPSRDGKTIDCRERVLHGRTCFSPVRTGGDVVLWRRRRVRLGKCRARRHQAAGFSCDPDHTGAWVRWSQNRRRASQFRSSTPFSPGAGGFAVAGVPGDSWRQRYTILVSKEPPP